MLVKTRRGVETEHFIVRPGCRPRSGRHHLQLAVVESSSPGHAGMLGGLKRRWLVSPTWPPAGLPEISAEAVNRRPNRASSRADLASRFDRCPAVRDFHQPLCQQTGLRLRQAGLFYLGHRRRRKLDDISLRAASRRLFKHFVLIAGRSPFSSLQLAHTQLTLFAASNGAIDHLEERHRRNQQSSSAIMP